ncbi:glycoside hydrolase family 3 protein, partial [Patellaria atrata CBS 101060]
MSISGPASAAPNVEELLPKLTLEEKVSLLAGADWWRTVGIQRDGVFIPKLKVSDGPNGARGESYVSGVKAACFPAESNLGCTFDTELIYRIGQELAEETKSKSADILLAPTVNIVRSPLGGRNFETYGEDPFLIGKLGAACVNGLLSRGTGACPKHFVANEAENKRRTLNVDVSETALREIYLYPFQIIMKESDPWCFMSSYNYVQGKPTGANKRLLTDILRDEWGFKGLIMSDWLGTYSTTEPIIAGMDLEMPGPYVQRGPKLVEAVKTGQVPQVTIDASTKRILTLLYKANKFSSPTEAPETAAESPIRDALICQAAADGMVLLKNTDSILPLKKGVKVAVIGQHADSTNMSGGGSARMTYPMRGVTPLQGLWGAEVEFEYHPGVPVYNALPLPEVDVVSAVDGVETEVEGLVRCEWFNSTTAGEKLMRTNWLKRPEYIIKEKWPVDLNLVDYCTRMKFVITPQTTGEHLLGVVSTGAAEVYVDGQLVLMREQEMDLIFESYMFQKPHLQRHTTYPMIADQPYTITLISRGASKEALSTLTTSQLGPMPLLEGTSLRFHEAYSIPSLTSAAATLASQYPIALVFVGKDADFESEGADQEGMALPSHQNALIAAVARANENVIVVNFSGSAVEMPWAEMGNVKAVIQAWYPGQEAGHAVAKVLTGEICPSGKLAQSFPCRIEDNPSFGNFPVGGDGVLRYVEGRDVGYRHFDRDGVRKARWPFGYGLSYTRFEYVEFGFVGESRIGGEKGILTISVEVKNIGNLVGKEIVQIYVVPPAHQVKESVSGSKRPVKELKGFTKVEVKPGAVIDAKIMLDKYAVSYWDEGLDAWRAEKGTYKALVAKSSVDVVGELEFEVEGEFTWKGV